MLIFKNQLRERRMDLAMVKVKTTLLVLLKEILLKYDFMEYSFIYFLYLIVVLRIFLIRIQ